MQSFPKVKVGQVWRPVGFPGGPSLKVLSVEGKMSHCQVIDRDRTLDVKTKRLQTGAAGYELVPKVKPLPQPIDAPSALLEEATA